MKQLLVRVSDELKARLEEAAAARDATLTQEVTDRLEKSFDVPDMRERVRGALQSITQFQRAAMQAAAEGSKVDPAIWGALLDLSGTSFQLIEVLRLLDARTKRDNSVLVPMPTKESEK
jgi:hypothetical protein